MAAPRLAAWLAQVFAACGFVERSAAEAADVIVRTNTRGVDTHGVMRVKVYVERLKAGEINPRPDVRFEDRHGLVHCRADRGLGQLVAMQAVEKAIAEARQRAFVPLLMERVGHLGALGLYTLRAADAGMIAFLVQSSPPLMGLPGSKGAAIGNNPIAFASPVPGGVPLVFDMATSGVARGNVLRAAAAGEAIPEGWAIDEEGRPTTDAAAALRGAMLPMAGHKGIGLAMMVECLAGSLTGADTAQKLTGATPSNAPAGVGAFLFVANPELIVGRTGYEAHMAAWLASYKRVTGPSARYPGEHAAEVERRRTRDGIPLPAGVLADLRQVGTLTGVPFPA